MAKVSTRRFLHAFRVVFMAAALASGLYSVVFRQPLVHTFLVNSVCASLVVVLYKLVLRTEFPRSASAARELVDGVLNVNNLLVFAGFFVSSEIYFRLALVPNMAAYYTQKVQSQSVPAGIPKSLALHRNNLWYVVNEEYYYLSTFITVFTAFYALVFVFNKKYVLDIQDAENGMRPLNRLVRRLPRVQKQAFLTLVGIAVYPIIYFSVVRPLFLTPLKLYGIVELTGFKFRFLFKPFSVMPLLVDFAFGYECFMAYLTLGPVYRGQPMTSTVSDPNGCLLTGLNAKYKSLAGMLAWSELGVIADEFPDRRKSVFKDVDQDRVAWTSINASFKALIQDQTAGLKPANKPKPQETRKPNKPQNPHNSNDLHNPHNTNDAHKHAERKPVPSEQLLLSRDILNPQKEQDSVAVHAEKASLYKPVSFIEKKLYTFARQLEADSDKKVEFAQKFVKKHAKTVYNYLRNAYIAFFQSPLGVPFIITFDRDLYAHLKHLRTTRYALHAMTSLISHSIAEDEFGYVQESVGEVLDEINTLTTALKLRLNNPHDHVPAVYKPVKESGGRRHSVGQDEAHELLNNLDLAFNEIAAVFRPYFGSMKVPEKVLKRAG